MLFRQTKKGNTGNQEKRPPIPPSGITRSIELTIDHPKGASNATVHPRQATILIAATWGTQLSKREAEIESPADKDERDMSCAWRIIAELDKQPVWTAPTLVSVVLSSRHLYVYGRRAWSPIN